MKRKPKQLELFPENSKPAKPKGEQVTKNGKPVKIPKRKQKHVQVLRGLMQKIISQKAWPQETYNGEKLPHADEKQLLMTIASLNYDPPDDIMRQLIAEHFLLCRSESTEDELATFYMCESKAISNLVKSRNKKSA